MSSDLVKRFNELQGLDESKVPARYLAEQTCALKNRCALCKSRGFIFEVSGALTTVNLCSCVKSCTKCLGHASSTDASGISQPCKSPPLHVTLSHFNAAQIPAKYAQASLGTFTNFSGNGKDVVMFVRNWISHFKPRGIKGFILGGGVGVGKTHLLAGVIKALVLKGYSAAFVDFFQLLAQLREAYASDKSDASLIQPLMYTDLLVIDELGKGRNTEWELTILDQLVMGRYNENKTIIASTNYNLNEDVPLNQNLSLEEDSFSYGSFASQQYMPLARRVGPRIYSRLKEMCHFTQLNGKDMRGGS